MTPEKQKLIDQFKALWELKGAKPTVRQAEKAGISDRQVRKHFGGWVVLQEMAAPDSSEMWVPSSDADLVVKRYKSLATSEKRKNTFKKYESEEYFRHLGNEIAKLDLKPIVLDKKQIHKYLNNIAQPTNIERELVCVFSDTHYGLTIDHEEVGGKNSYGWKEACRRTAHMCQEVASYKMEHRKSTKKLHVAYLGDLINGVIHNKAGLDNDLLVHQECGLFHIVYHSISYLLNFFDEIEVYALAGNHDRRLHREDGGRVTSQKYDSHVAPVFFALSAAFKGRVKFNIPKTQHVFIDTIGGRILGAHADTSFNAIGQPGSSVNTKALSHQIETFNAGEIKVGNPDIKGMVFGHVHNELQVRTQNGIEVVVNSCLSGLDPFASSLTINSSLQSQTIIESSKAFAIGDIRRVRFSGKIDSDSSLDKIIPIYKRELVFGG